MTSRRKEANPDDQQIILMGMMDYGKRHLWLNTQMMIKERCRWQEYLKFLTINSNQQFSNGGSPYLPKLIVSACVFPRRHLCAEHNIKFNIPQIY
jgi:hypothetical protein